MEETRVTTITAAEWDAIAEDVKAGRCEARYDYDSESVSNIVDMGTYYDVHLKNGYVAHSPKHNPKWGFSVTWLKQSAPAGEVIGIHEAAKRQFEDARRLQAREVDIHITREDVRTLLEENEQLRNRVQTLEGVLTTIKDYPVIETGMDAWHLIAGMVGQAEFGLEAELVDDAKGGEG